MEQRPVVSELVLVIIVVLFVGACASVINLVHRGLPQAATLAAAETPSTVAATATATPRRNPLAAAATSAVAPTSTPVAAAVPTATPTPSRSTYATVTGAQLNSAPDQYQGKKVVISGRVFYVSPRGENTWVQVLTPDNVFVDVNFAGQSDILKDQQVKVYGTAAAKTTIKANDGNTYVQPLIDPGDFIDKA